VHGEGDALGERIRLLLFQHFILNRIYEFDPETGRLLHDTVLLVISKGNSKTELCGQLANVEFQSPLAPLRSPKVTISAASWKQADELLNASQLAITGSDESPGPLAPKFQRGLHLLDDKIIAPNGGRLQRLAAVGSTADGGKETCHIGDEIHEWNGARPERMWTVKGRSLRKRKVPRGICARCVAADPNTTTAELVTRRGAAPVHRDRSIDRLHAALPIRGSLQIGITTVGDDPTVVTEDPATLLGRLWHRGVDVAEGRSVEPTFLFMAWQAEAGLDLENDADLTQGILQANPAAGFPDLPPMYPGAALPFLSVEEKKRSILDPTVSRAEGERYDLGWWSQAKDSWMSVRAWTARDIRKQPKWTDDGPLGMVRWLGKLAPPKGTKVWLGFDGSKSRDSTGLWGCTAESHVFKLAVWERPSNADPGWQVPHLEVDAAVKEAFDLYDVQIMQMDPPRWENELETWSGYWPGRVVAFDTNVYERFAPAVGRFMDGVLGNFDVGGELVGEPSITHDGDPVLTRHIANARKKETRWGVVITKEHKDSPRRIDAAVAAVLAHDGLTVPAKVNRTLHLSSLGGSR
jgi:phage terminase large subunit-like protein